MDLLLRGTPATVKEVSDLTKFTLPCIHFMLVSSDELEVLHRWSNPPFAKECAISLAAEEHPSKGYWCDGREDKGNHPSP